MKITDDINQWKDIIGYKGFYQINIYGEVRSLNKQNFQKNIKYRIDRAGYYTVVLHKNYKSCTKYVHRLLATAFLPNNLNKACINHIDGNKLNNQLENLEWVTYSENMKHAFRIGLYKKSSNKSKPVINNCTGEKYKSMSEAAKICNIPIKTLTQKLTGRLINETCLSLNMVA